MSDKIELTLELLQSLDINVGRLMGLLKDPIYRPIIIEYEIDQVQCSLYWDTAQILAFILDAHDYEDLILSSQELGYETKKVLAKHETKFLNLKRLLLQYDILHENNQIGKIVKELIEDIQSLSLSIKNRIDEIFSSQAEINDIIKKRNKNI